MNCYSKNNLYGCATEAEPYIHCFLTWPSLAEPRSSNWQQGEGEGGEGGEGEGEGGGQKP